MNGDSFEIICTRCRSSVASDIEICPGCGLVLLHRRDGVIAPSMPPLPDAAHETAAAKHRRPRVWSWRRHRPAEGGVR